MLSFIKIARYTKFKIFQFDRSKLVGVAALLCALGLTLASAGFVYASVNRLHLAFDWVQHTDSVILQMVNIEKDLLSADSTTRAQVYAGTNPNQKNAQLANNSIMAEVERLAALVADNPDQTRRILLLQAIIAERAIALPKREGAEFRRMSSIRAEIQEVQNAEWKLLQDRTAVEEHATIVSLSRATLTGFFALVLGALGIYLLTKESAHRRYAELELMRIQRLNMMSLTTMALAHEINQPLAAAGNYQAACLRLAKAPDANVSTKIIDAATHAQEQVLRAGKIIKRLRSFIEKSGDERTIESPGTIIDDAISLIGTIDGSIKVETQIESNLPCVSVDRVQLQQVLINLIRNSIEAMGGGKRSELMLSVRAVDSTHVCFSVADNGPGLPKKVLENIFKAFESTKVGGLGVGLTICKAIIAAHGGTISASNVLSGGTIISFTLPVAYEQMAA
ncbi:MAG: ATP-binding protein [Rhizomicrobium sp.]|nr:ATP-binding protein [Rhizomicrobium sp.]